MAYTTINKHTDYFNTVLYTGNGSAGNAQTGVGFQPDFTWIKGRSATYNHGLYDAVRGVTKRIVSNNNNAEDTRADALTAFGTDGFTLGTDSQVNANTATYASWNWKASGSTASNSNGSINSTVSVNTTAGFSIVTYTGTGSTATVGHGLGVVPSMIIIKRRDDTDDWQIYHKSIGNTKYLAFNSTAAATTSSTRWNDTTPTNSVFTVGTAGATNGSGRTFVAYCFAEKAGYSSIGSYKGIGNADGTFVYTGFKPAFVIIKGAVSGDGNAGQHWELFDNKRLGYNVDNNSLLPSSSGTENTGDRIDLLSNGFKIRISSDGVNDNNSTYIYMAFGQSLVGSNNVPCTAR